MRIVWLVSLLVLGLPALGLPQENTPPTQTIRDLDFLIGTWAIRTEHFDPRNPEAGVELEETGTMTCRYDFEFNGSPAFIVCEHELTGSNGWHRMVLQYLRYSRFTDAFQFVGMFTNWPAAARGTLHNHPEERELELRYDLEVRNAIERGQDLYFFNDDFSEFRIEGVSNMSDMGITEFNPAFTTVGKKIG